eukprot:PhM_4_TR8396/c4_g1_i1/m.62505
MIIPENPNFLFLRYQIYEREISHLISTHYSSMEHTIFGSARRDVFEMYRLQLSAEEREARSILEMLEADERVHVIGNAVGSSVFHAERVAAVAHKKHRREALLHSKIDTKLAEREQLQAELDLVAGRVMYLEQKRQREEALEKRAQAERQRLVLVERLRRQLVSTQSSEQRARDDISHTELSARHTIQKECPRARVVAKQAERDRVEAEEELARQQEVVRQAVKLRAKQEEQERLDALRAVSEQLRAACTHGRGGGSCLRGAFAKRMCGKCGVQVDPLTGFYYVKNNNE